MVLSTEVIEKMDLFILQLIPNKMKMTKKQYYNFIKKNYPNCFLSTKVNSFMFEYIVTEFFKYGDGKPKGNFDDAIFIFKIWNNVAINFREKSLLSEDQSLRYIKLLKAGKYSFMNQRYDLSIRINKLLITYFSKLTK
jgi:hypothetical protein